MGAAVQVGQGQQLPCGVDGGEEGVGDAVERQVVALAAVVGRVEDVVERRREVVAGQLVVEPRAGPLIARGSTAAGARPSRPGGGPGCCSEGACRPCRVRV